MKFEADIEDQRTKMLQALIEASKNEKLSPREQKEIQDGINKIAKDKLPKGRINWRSIHDLIYCRKNKRAY